MLPHPVVVEQPEPHLERTRQMLKAHPELSGLFGPFLGTFPIVLAVVGLQVGLAWALRDVGTGWLLLCAWTVGAVANHALFVLIHECTHNLVFVRPSANLLLQLVANLPIVVPSAVSFRRYHLLHHRFQGDPQWDADLPAPFEVRFAGSSPWGKAAWMLLFPLFQVARVLQLRSIPIVDAWWVANVAVQGAFTAAVAWGWGGGAVAYLLLSTFFSVGFHPLGARWVQEHFLVHGDAPAQETSSYVGPLNLLAFNVGFHVEHHDLMRVAWPRLPRVRALAPGYYAGLATHASWTRLWWRFLVDRRISLHSRVLRGVPGIVPNWTGSTLGPAGLPTRQEAVPIPPAQSA
jgi:sphingolipid delta-4 desaturase